MIDVSGPRSGIDTSRVGEVKVTLPGGHRRRGSGLLLRDNLLITSWHVVVGAEAASVDFESGTDRCWSAILVATTRVGKSDIALVELDATRRRVEPLEVAALGDLGHEFAVDTVGFPRWKIRNVDGTVPYMSDNKPKYRACAQVPARLISGSNGRDGTFELIVDPPERDLDSTASPWEGMSGAPVYCAGFVVGVISYHHRREGLNRLSATRLDKCLDTLSIGHSELVFAKLGLQSRGEIPNILSRIQSNPLARLAYLVNGSLPKVASVRDPALLGIHPSVALENEGRWQHLDPRLPEYVSRDQDESLRDALAQARGQGGTVILVGPSTAGKTRSAAEAIWTNFYDWNLLIPLSPGALQRLVDVADELIPPNTIVWLNEAQTYLSLPGLTMARFTALLGGPSRPRIVLGTMWPRWIDAFRPVPNELSRTANSDAFQVIGSAQKIVFSADLSPSEFARAIRTADPRVTSAAYSGAGLAEYLAASPEAWNRWIRHRSDSDAIAAVGAAIVSSAVDAYRAGRHGGLSATLLRKLYLTYLPSRTRERMGRKKLFKRGLKWALEPVHGATSLLIRNKGGFSAFDYLVSQTLADPRREIVSEDVCSILSEDVDNVVAALHFADAAIRLGYKNIAQRILRRFATEGFENDYVTAVFVRLINVVGDIDLLWEAAIARSASAVHTLAIELFDRSDAEGLLRLVGKTGSVLAGELLATLLVRWRDLDSLATLARECKHEVFFNALEHVIEEISTEGDNLSGEDFLALEWARIHGEWGDLEGLARLSQDDNRFATQELLELLVQRGDTRGLSRLAFIDKAESARNSLVDQLLAAGDVVALERWAEAHGDRYSKRALLELLTGEEHLRKLHREAGKVNADVTVHLAWTYAQRGDIGSLRALSEATPLEFPRKLLSCILSMANDKDQLRELADMGMSEASRELANMVRDSRDIEYLRTWVFEANDISARESLAALVGELGSHDEKTRLLRAVAEDQPPVEAQFEASFYADLTFDMFDED